jgi:fibronectin-binding autotransporter adhesin
VVGGSLLLAGGEDRLFANGFLTAAGGVLDLCGNRQSTLGIITLAGGLVQNGTLTGSGAAFVAQAGVVSAILAGTQGLVKDGAGSLTLSAVNTYSGDTVVNGGSLLLSGGNDRLFTGGAITATGGVLDLGGNSQTTLGTITFAGGVVQSGTLIASGTAFLGQAGAVSAILAGTQGLVKDGAASLTLSGMNTYAGGTTVIGGSLLLSGGNDRLYTSGSITMTDGVLDLGGNSQSTLGRIVFAGGVVQNGTLLSSGTAFLAQAGTVSATLAGAQGLVKDGPGSMTLSGVNAYSGGTNVNDGTLFLAGGNNRLSASGSITTTGGVLDLGGSGQATLGTITFAGGVVQNGTLTATGTAFVGQAGTVSANLDGTEGLVKTGALSLTLSAVNRYTGGTTIEDGSLLLSGGDDRLSLSGSITTTGGVLDLGGNSQTTLSTITFAGGVVQNGTLTATGTAFVGQVGTVSANLAGTQGLVKTGALSLTLSGVNRYTGGTTIEDGSLLLSGGDDRLSLSGSITTTGGVLDLGGNAQTTLGTITFAGGTVQNGTLTATGAAFVGQAGVVSAILSGTQGLAKGGPGSLTLSAVNTYTV